MTLLELFPDDRSEQQIDPGARILPGFALGETAGLLAAIDAIQTQAPLRHLVTPGGQSMSVAMTNCGRAGWYSDRKGYRYTRTDPLTGMPWPAMPSVFLQLAQRAASHCGYDDFDPDACLVNFYAPGARMSPHQDRDEGNLTAPIVSVSLGLPATFLWGGLKRNDRQRRFRLAHGDVVVWGGPTRLAYHGVAPLAEGDHPVTGRKRFNLTFRQAYA